MPVATVHGGFQRIRAPGRAYRVQETAGRAAGGVDLLIVMGLADFHVPFGAEPLGRLADEMVKQVDAHAHVGRPQRGNRARRRPQRGVVSVAQPGRSAEERDLLLNAPGQPGSKPGWQREFNYEVTLRLNLCGDGKIQRFNSGNETGIPAEVGIVGRGDSARQNKITSFGDKPSQRQAHAAAIAHDRSANRIHEIVSRSSRISRSVFMSAARRAHSRPARSVFRAASR